MNECFTGLLFGSVVVWIGEVLLFAVSAENILVKLRAFFKILRDKNHPLSAKKRKLYTPKVMW